ncbi:MULTISPECIES: N-acetylmuramoyl-L-alanine amidase [unclassified Leptolyngbya]|uniref:N-acetylmuramoyl-L-alanine amidase n=1 Tax=unclassified Leptolyngbya TaxID=2650499 RepID=UPI0016878056|nr:N-acetylmuramoyl-L-alanine amidase [Leptolyngbya sp. FACHB-8]MBD2156570.1 N-acetylmuramoyl-L-alanine amidase [Leptolyngbya sp. FACHB-16]
MNFKWIVPSVVGVVGSLLVSTSAAYAGTLQNWRFDSNQNRLVLVTDEGVQPRAQLIADPTRLVIDLPGIQLGQSTLRQSVSGAVREVRVGQFDASTTRIVVELSPGYTLNPEQIVIRGATPTEWSIQLPTPQLSQNPTQPPSNPRPSPTPSENTPPGSSGVAQIQDIQTVTDGFFIRTTGGTPRVSLDRNRDRDELRIDLRDARLASNLDDRTLQVNSSGVESIELNQRRRDRARITLNLEDEDINWVASVAPNGITLIRNRLSGDRVVTSRTPVATTPPSTQPPTQPSPPTRPPTQPPTQTQVTQVESVELDRSGQRLLIRTNQPFRYRTERDRSTGAFNIIIPSARLADSIPDPQLDRNSPLRRVRLRQETDQSVVIQVEPAANVQIGEANLVSQQLLALELQRQNTPSRPNPPSAGGLPEVRSGLTVVLDPGHGGYDPGAVGRGGLEEEDVVLDVGLKVAQILEQQGVRVVMTRQGDTDIDLEPRVQIAENSNANIFVSIHANSISLSRPEVNGIETFYASPEGARLGRVIHDSMIQFSGFNDRGLKSARFYVIRNTSMPAVLLEIGFVTGAHDAPLLADSDWRSQMSVAIARGILQYLSQNY